MKDQKKEAIRWIAEQLALRRAIPSDLKGVTYEYLDVQDDVRVLFESTIIRQATSGSRIMWKNAEGYMGRWTGEAEKRIGLPFNELPHPPHGYEYALKREVDVVI